MKKVWLIGLALMMVLSAVVFVSADQVAGVVTDDERLALIEKRMEDKIEAIEQMVVDGKITAEQAQVWKDHFTQMLAFHKENGFLTCEPGSGGMGMGRGQRGGFGLRDGSCRGPLTGLK